MAQPLDPLARHAAGPMRLLIGSRIDLVKIGGVSTLVRSLARGCAAAGDEVVLLKPGEAGPEQIQIDGLPYHRLPMRNPPAPPRTLRNSAAFAVYAPLAFALLIRMLRARRVQVVNAHYFDDAWFYLIRLRRWLGFRLVVSVHGDDVRGADAPRNLRLLRQWAGEIDRIVFCSSGFRDEVFAPDDPIRRKTVVILNGVDVDPAAPGTAPRQNRIICVAHLFTRKGIDVLIEAFGLLAARHPGLQLVIVGDGPERPALEAQAAALGLSDRVEFVGIVERSDALVMIQSSRVFCLPSRREPFGLVLAEAMALGTPIVATRTGGIPEVVREGVDALLVEAGDSPALAGALTQVLENPDLAERLAASARERWHTSLRPERLVREYRTLFEGLIAEPDR